MTKAVTSAASSRATRRATRPHRSAHAHARARRAAAQLQRQQARTVKAQTRFLKEFAVHGIIRHAAAAAKVGRRTVYDWIEGDETFPARKADAHEDAADGLEAEARRRGVSGVDEPVYGSGGTGVGTVQVGVIRKFSDRLLELLLKARRPAVFREHHEVTGKGGGPIQIQPVTDSELDARIAELEREVYGDRPPRLGE
jgi:hypothetical protein